MRELLARPAPRALVWAGFGLALVAAWNVGRWSEPQEQSSSVVLVTRTVERQQKKSAAARVQYVDRVIYRERETRLNGTKIERESERESARLNERAETSSERTAQSDARQEIRIATVDRPDWRVSAQVGASLQAPAVPIAGLLVIGAQVERRIAGGVSAGVWGNTAGAAGVSVSVEF